MAPGTTFQPVLTETVADPSKVERVVLLSGKTYFELAKQREERKLDGKIVFIRIEVRKRLPTPRSNRSDSLFPQEISPFPYKAVSEALAPFSKAKSVVWAQDEPENAGAYLFVLPRLQQVLPRARELEYVGRDAMATPAPGVKKYFEEQRKDIEERIFAGL